MADKPRRPRLAVLLLLALPQLWPAPASGQGLLPSHSTVTGSSGRHATLQSLYQDSRAWRLAYKQAPARACGGSASSGLCGPADEKSAEELAVLTWSTSPFSFRSPAIPPAGDQGGCNACTAFAVAGAASAAIAAVHGVDPRQASFSVQSLFFCPDAAGGPERRCQGKGWKLEDGVAELTRRHRELPTQACHPYAADLTGLAGLQQLCRATCSASNAFSSQGTFSFLAIGSAGQAQEHIRRYGAVISTFEIMSDLRAWGASKANARAVYRPSYTSKFVAHHAVLLVGYELSDEPSGGHWLALNSWGPNWGDSGLFKVAFDAAGILAPDKGEAYGLVWSPVQTPAAAQLPVVPARGRPGCYEYQARPGDYLSGVAWRARLDLGQFMQDNSARVASLDAPLAGTWLLLCKPAAAAIRDLTAHVDAQLESLLALKAAVDQGNTLRDWTRAGGYCSWHGVVCRPGTQTVLAVKLWADTVGTGLRGALPPAAALRGLTGLTALGIAQQPRIDGNLPADWSELRQLQDLGLSKNSLSGPLPPSWSALTRLRTLFLNTNKLDGPLPDSWKALTNIQQLDLGRNRLSGSLPSSWSALVQLKVLALHFNTLTGVLPDSWKALTSVEDMQLGGNLLSGTLPQSWSALIRLKILFLDMNTLRGPLPDSWSALTALETLAAYRNHLSGSLPGSWSRLTRLQTLYVYGNKLSGSLPGSWSALARLERLDLSENNLSGRVPASWAGMARLVQVSLWGNKQLSGCVPASWKASLRTWDVLNQVQGDTQLSGYC